MSEQTATERLRELLDDREDGLCYRDPNHCGCYRPAHDDGFCAWAKKMEEDV